MTYRVHQVNKKTGLTYVYEATSVWDKEKKQPRNKQICIGKLDPKTGEFIPSRRLNPEQAAVRDPAVTATAVVVGHSLILDKITSELGLNKVLKASFPETYEQILSMAYYITSRGGPLSHLSIWSRNHAHPFGKELTSQRISEILRILGHDGQKTFFKIWGKKVVDNNDYLCYDITSISSYGELNEYLKYGYNRDEEGLRQINLAILFSQKSKLPVYYNRLPGNISDVTTLHHLLKTLSYIGATRLHFVLDRGFYSQKNVDELLTKRHRFILAVPIQRKWVQNIIDEVRESIQDPQNYKKIDDEILYVHTRLYPWGKERRRTYVHLYYNAHAASEATDRFTEELLGYKEELEKGLQVKDHEDAYRTFFTIKETPIRGLRVLFNNEAIKRYRNRYAGFHILLTNDIKDPVEALKVYRNKDSIEKCFDDLKNQLDMKRLRIHTSPAMDGRLFVQFIALIYMSALRKKMRETRLIERYTVRELLMEVETLTKVRYSGKYGHILTEVTKPQKEILEKLKIELET